MRFGCLICRVKGGVGGVSEGVSGRREGALGGRDGAFVEGGSERAFRRAGVLGV